MSDEKIDLSPMEKIVGLLASISTKTLNSMLTDVETILDANLDIPDFQHVALVEWAAYISEEIRFRQEDGPDCCDHCCDDCDGDGCGGTDETKCYDCDGNEVDEDIDPNSKLN